MPPKKKRNFKLPLKSPGLLEQYVRTNFSPIPDNDLLNGHVLVMFFEIKRSLPDTIQALLEKKCITVQRRAVANLVDKTINKYTHLDRKIERDCLNAICHQKFDLLSEVAPLPTSPLLSASMSSSPEPSSTSLLAPEPSPILASSTPFMSTSPVSQSCATSSVSPPSTTSPMSPPSSTRHSSRSNPLTPRKQKMRTRLDYVSESRSTMKKKYQNKLRRMREQLSKSVSRSQHNQAIRRKVNMITKLQKQKREH